MEKLEYYLGPPFKLFGTSVSFDDADIVAYGIPLDSTTTFKKGCSRGPNAIREASLEIETFISDRSIDVLDVNSICDIGDIWISKGDVTQALDTITKVTSIILDAGKLPIALGGEHLISLGCVRAFDDISLVVFDAHADLRDEYMGDKYSHATWLYHAMSVIKPENILVVGVRSLSKEEHKLAEEKDITMLFMHDILNDMDDTLALLREKTSGKRVYLSFDVDAYDTSYVPATGTPEPGGLTIHQAAEFLRNINGEIVGVDITETARDPEMITPTTAAKTIVEILGLFA